MLEIKNTVLVVFIFLKHNDPYRRLADSYYFNTGINTLHEFSGTHNSICVHAIYEGLEVTVEVIL